MWDRVVQVEGKNAALLDSIARMKEAISLNAILARETEVTSSPGRNAKIVLGPVDCMAQQGCSGMNAAQAPTDCSSAGERNNAGHPVFHWSGIDICQVAKQRDDALQEALVLSAELSSAQRELFLSRSQSQISRAAQESAAQVCSWQCLSARVLHVLTLRQSAGLILPACRLLARCQNCRCGVPT